MVKVDPKQLFEAKKDIRKFMSVGMSDENTTYFEEEYGITDIELLLSHASIYVNLGELPEAIEVKELEE